MPKQKIGFTITCATGCAPTYIRVKTNEMSGSELLNTEKPKKSGIYKGELTVDIVVPKISFTVMVAGSSGEENKCNFSIDGVAVFKEDRKLTETRRGKYRFYAQHILS